MAHITYVIDFKNYASKQNNYNKIELIENKIIPLNLFFLMNLLPSRHQVPLQGEELREKKNERRTEQK